MKVCWIAYNGKPFHGFCVQPSLRTIEGEILTVLSDLGYLKKKKVYYSSRTDKGVSALMNIIAFDYNGKIDIPSVNKRLSDIWFVAQANLEKFNPRGATRKWYKYFLKDEGQNIDLMKKAANLFIGKKNFKLFSKIDKKKKSIDFYREIFKIRIGSWKKWIIIDIIGRSFLWQMVRRIVKALDMVGKGEIDIPILERALKGIGNPFPPAPAENLILWKIDFPFEINWEL